jgi:hypothetical protein
MTLQDWSQVANVIIAGASVLALVQIFILKKDISVRNERAAKEKAIEYAERYLTVYVKASDKFDVEVRAGKLPDFKGTIGNFDILSLSNEERERARARTNLVWLDSANILNSIAAAYITGVADEQTGFRIIGRSYVFAVKSMYDILCILRTDRGQKYMSAIVELYEIWAPRLEKAELSEIQKNIEKKMESLPDLRGSSIGGKR